MHSAELTRGVRILRCAPWPAVLGGAITAGVLLVIAALAHRTSMSPLITLLGLSACGGTAAYILDDESRAVADATPVTRRRRTAWRMPVLAVPAAVAIAGLLLLDRLDTATNWLWLGPLAVGVIAVGVALAAALGRAEGSTPGDLAGVVTVTATVLFVALNPLRRWVAVAPLDGAGHADRSLVLWIAVTAACGGVVLACTRDPGRQDAPKRNQPKGPGRRRQRERM
jgi:hypothetical protein